MAERELRGDAQVTEGPALKRVLAQLAAFDAQHGAVELGLL